VLAAGQQIVGRHDALSRWTPSEQPLVETDDAMERIGGRSMRAGEVRHRAFDLVKHRPQVQVIVTESRPQNARQRIDVVRIARCP